MANEEYCDDPVVQDLAVSLKGVHKAFGNTEALSGVCLDIWRGERIHIRGSNGSGKTTLLKIIAGLIYPDNGRVLSTCNSIGYLGHQALVYRSLSVEDNIRLMLGVRGITYDVDTILGRWKLAGARRKLCGNLSRGQIQKLGLAIACELGKEMLILDEPFTALDSEGEQTFMEELFQLSSAGVTIVLVSHEEDKVTAVCNKNYTLHLGRIQPSNL